MEIEVDSIEVDSACDTVDSDEHSTEDSVCDSEATELVTEGVAGAWSFSTLSAGNFTVSSNSGGVSLGIGPVGAAKPFGRGASSRRKWRMILESSLLRSTGLTDDEDVDSVAVLEVDDVDIDAEGEELDSVALEELDEASEEDEVSVADSVWDGVGLGASTCIIGGEGA